jgi:hypothetical protein
MFPAWRTKLLYPVIPGVKDIDDKIGPQMLPFSILDTVSNIHSEYISSPRSLSSKILYINKLEMNIMCSNSTISSNVEALYDQKISLLETFLGIN